MDILLDVLLEFIIVNGADTTHTVRSQMVLELIDVHAVLAEDSQQLLFLFDLILELVCKVNLHIETAQAIRILLMNRQLHCIGVSFVVVLSKVNMVDVVIGFVFVAEELSYHGVLGGRVG